MAKESPAARLKRQQKISSAKDPTDWWYDCLDLNRIAADVLTGIQVGPITPLDAWERALKSMDKGLYERSALVESQTDDVAALAAARRLFTRTTRFVTEIGRGNTPLRSCWTQEEREQLTVIAHSVTDYREIPGAYRHWALIKSRTKFPDRSDRDIWSALGRIRIRRHDVVAIGVLQDALGVGQTSIFRWFEDKKVGPLVLLPAVHQMAVQFPHRFCGASNSALQWLVPFSIDPIVREQINFGRECHPNQKGTVWLIGDMATGNTRALANVMGVEAESLMHGRIRKAHKISGMQLSEMGRSMMRSLTPCKNSAEIRTALAKGDAA
ncbi:MAG: hypothetical protein AAGF75_08890 [Cyanobacteria bacterium P01_H01_bin.130]